MLPDGVRSMVTERGGCTGRVSVEVVGVEIGDEYGLKSG